MLQRVVSAAAEKLRASPQLLLGAASGQRDGDSERARTAALLEAVGANPDNALCPVKGVGVGVDVDAPARPPAAQLVRAATQAPAREL